MTSEPNLFGRSVAAPIETDGVDHEILRLLREDARLSARAIARRVGMSAGAVSERISRLERGGAIAGYQAQINAPALGYGLLATVGLRTVHGQSSLRQMLQRIREIPEVEAIYVVTGPWDLMLHVRLRDQDHLSEILFDRIWKTAGFQHSETMITLYEQTNVNGGLPPVSDVSTDSDSKSQRSQIATGRARVRS